MKTTIPTNAQYHAGEMKRHANHIARIERAPLADRQAARADFARTLADTDAAVARLGFLFLGNYGYGAMMAARDILARPRMNRIAALSQLVAAYEDSCPANFARDAYMALSLEQQRAIDAAFAAAIQSELADIASAT